MAKSSLANLVLARRKAGLLVPIIDGVLVDMAIGEAGDRVDGFFHPSDLAGRFCPQHWVLFQHQPKAALAKSGQVSPRQMRIFDNGRAVHSRIQGYLMRSGCLWGRYVNAVTQDEHIGFAPKGAGWVYDEVGLEHPDDNIIGHTDGLARIRDKRKVGVELKGINENGMRWLRENPFKVHIEQAQIYMHCLNDMQARATQFVDAFDEEPLTGFVLLYEAKNDQEMREFFVPNDKDAIAEMMGKKRKWMTRAREYAPGDEMPPCRCAPKQVKPLCALFDDGTLQAPSAA